MPMATATSTFMSRVRWRSASTAPVKNMRAAHSTGRLSGPSHRRMVERRLRGDGLLLRVADAAGHIAAGALEAALFEEAPQILNRGELRVVGDGGRLPHRVGLRLHHPWQRSKRLLR